MARNTRAGTEATRAALVAAARELFVARGFAETATPDVVEAAGVTRGALYHHFADKKALFRAVVAAEAEGVARDIDTASAPATTPRDALLAGADAYFSAMALPGRVRLLLLEAPAVLGVDGAGEIDRNNAEGRLRQGIAELTGNPEEDPEGGVLTALLSAAFDRAVLEIHRGADPALCRRSIARLIDGLARK